jgi:hypothetical protein
MAELFIVDFSSQQSGLLVPKNAISLEYFDEPGLPKIPGESLLWSAKRSTVFQMRYS